MGLFDRFKKRVEETEKKLGITVDEDSPEAMEALEKRKELQKNLPNKKNIETVYNTETNDKWEEYDTELIDPFTTPSSSKDRKLKNRLKSNTTQKKSKSKDLITTTGKKLIKLENKSIIIDLSEDELSRRGRIIKQSKLLDEILEELETELLSVDMGHSAVSELIDLLRANLVGTRVPRKAKLGEIVERAVHRSLSHLLESEYWDFDKTVQSLISDESPISIMIVGVNGTGKTTSTAKIAKRLTDQGYSVVLAAADTFRAGAIDQLSGHAEKIGVRCIKSQRGGDSAALARDAIESARAKDDDIVIIDTAGRMQNKTNLMEELRKVRRVSNPHLVLFVADALAGNDAVTQAVEFQKMLEFDGAILCKLDTDARGGAALSIAHATGKPIILAGIGQGYDDLEIFNPQWLLNSILT